MRDFHADCPTCAYLSAEHQCLALWPDNTETGIIIRRIYVAPQDSLLAPVEHVWRFWCKGAQHCLLPAPVKTKNR